jgi:hypothetical protein
MLHVAIVGWRFGSSLGPLPFCLREGKMEYAARHSPRAAIFFKCLLNDGVLSGQSLGS